MMAPRMSLHSGPCSWCVRLAKWLPVVFIVAILVWSYYAYVIQLNILTIESILKKSLYLLVYHVLLVLFVWSYWQTIFTEVGSVPKQFRLPPIEMEAYECAPTDENRREVLERFVAKHGLPVANRTMTGEVRYCEKCCHIKADRCHHCSVCGDCVLKMDHHCPWVNNCVSFTNYKFFVLFLGYAFIYCLFVSFTTLEYLIMFWRSDLHGAGKFHILFVFFVSIMFAISLVSLLGYHIFLIFKNRSTIESFRGPIFHVNHSWMQDKEGFSLGAYNNFIEIFGDNRRHWFLPLFSSCGDGVTYPMRFERQQLYHQPQQQQQQQQHSLSSPSTTTTTAVAAAAAAAHPAAPFPPHSSYTSSTTTSTPPSYGSTNSMGDGVSYPQRCLDEDMDGLLGSDVSVTDWDQPTDSHHMVDRHGLEEVVVQSNHTYPV